MPHTRDQEPVAEGATYWIPVVVKAVHPERETCQATVEAANGFTFDVCAENLVKWPAGHPTAI